MKEQLEQYFIPTLREGAAAGAIQKAVTAAQEMIDAIHPNGTAQLYGGGCMTAAFGLVTFCGFDTFSQIVQRFGLRAVMVGSTAPTRVVDR
jgi:hypothetical protein